MPAIVDELQIELSAKAVKANTAIDTLITKLDKLSTSLEKINGNSLAGLANGVNKLGSAMQAMNQVKTSDFTRLTKNLEKLGNVNVAALNSAASSLSHLTRAFNNLGTVSANAQQVGDLAKNLSKLGNASVQKAITNIPQLAISMQNLLTILSRSPQVSRNVINLTNALANLANQGRGLGQVNSAMSNSFNQTSSSMVNTTKKGFSLARMFGTLYANYFLLFRGINKLSGAIESAADYIEAYNYYNVAFSQVASQWSKDFEKYGYENAEAYADSFTSRVNEVIAKTTGQQINVDTGIIESTGGKNLGLNIL